MPVLPPSHAKKVWEGKISTAWEWPQELFDGTTETFECITRQDSTTVIAFIDPQTIIVTKQEQPGRTPFIDVPGGRVDAGEDHLHACQRELAEETGYTAADDDWLLWKRRAHEGGVRYEETLYIARNAKKTHDCHIDGGEHIEVSPTSWTEAIDLCLRGKMRQPSVMHTILCMHFDDEAKQKLTEYLNGD